jgi:serpin B
MRAAHPGTISLLKGRTATGNWPLFVLFGLLFLASVSGSPRALEDAEPPPDLKPVVDGNGAFAMDLYAHLKDADGNLFFSPYGISSALAMAYGGARGNTEKQFSATLHFPADQAMFHAAMGKLRRKLANIGDSRRVDLNIANGLWTQKGCSLIPAFLDLAKEQYGAVPNPADFITDRETVRRQINLWIESQTRQKIKAALPAGRLSADTRAVIVNAIYFKGDWASRFDAGRTEPVLFWITPARSVLTPMMHQNQVFRYAEQEDLRILELPYVGYDLSMLVLLPRDRDGLPGLEQGLKGDNVARWIKALGVRDVDVSFPKFRTETRFHLAQTLSAMGMPDAFNPGRADFTGMTTNRPLCLEAVEHAALVEVDEKGTVAAAATSLAISCAAHETPPPSAFHADHPFIFLIRDNHTGTILFLGRIMNPTK